MGAVEPQGALSGQSRDEESKKRMASAAPRNMERETTDMALLEEMISWAKAISR